MLDFREYMPRPGISGPEDVAGVALYRAQGLRHFYLL